MLSILVSTWRQASNCYRNNYLFKRHLSLSAALPKLLNFPRQPRRPGLLATTDALSVKRRGEIFRKQTKFSRKIADCARRHQTKPLFDRAFCFKKTSKPRRVESVCNSLSSAGRNIFDVRLSAASLTCSLVIATRIRTHTHARSHSTGRPAWISAFRATTITRQLICERGTMRSRDTSALFFRSRTKTSRMRASSNPQRRGGMLRGLVSL